MVGDAKEIVQLRIAMEHDVFLARQRGREVAAAVGFENQDQVRIATALSELGRELAVLDGTARITLSLVSAPVPTMLIDATWDEPLPGTASTAELALVEGIAAAARLVDACVVRWREDGGTVELTKKLPLGAAAPTKDRLTAIRTMVRRSRPGNTLDALRSQNQDLLETLENLQARQDDLLRANAELEETNRGVMALHAELSDELEQTNRGVVALYAELDEASTRLREASDSKTRFWSNVSHELRTPLNSVLGLSRLLLDDSSEPLRGEQRFQVELVRDSGAMLLSLVNDLLDVAKAESGRLEAQVEAVDLRTVFGELRASLRPLAIDPEVALMVDEPTGVPVLRTDPVLLGQILRNLLSNGLKFTERGHVHCHARADHESGELEVLVIDTGIGIPAEHQRGVFEEFYQVAGPAQIRARGTGLGLPYARKLAGILGGALTLTSAPGQGTTVTLRLPLDVVSSRNLASLGSVLLVDDDPAFRTLVKRMLGSIVVQLTEVDDGPSALRVLRASRPDLMLLDLHIPPPDGAEILASMRRDKDLRHVPVVVVTSAELADAQRASLTSTAVVLDKAELDVDGLLAAAEAATRLARELR